MSAALSKLARVIGSALLAFADEHDQERAKTRDTSRPTWATADRIADRYGIETKTVQRSGVESRRVGRVRVYHVDAFETWIAAQPAARRAAPRPTAPESTDSFADAVAPRRRKRVAA